MNQKIILNYVKLYQHILEQHQIFLDDRDFDVPEDVRQQLEFIFCDRIDQVLANALVNDRAVRSNHNGSLGEVKLMRTSGTEIEQINHKSITNQI